MSLTFITNHPVWKSVENWANYGHLNCTCTIDANVMNGQEALFKDGRRVNNVSPHWLSAAVSHLAFLYISMISTTTMQYRMPPARLAVYAGGRYFITRPLTKQAKKTVAGTITQGDRHRRRDTEWHTVEHYSSGLHTNYTTHIYWCGFSVPTLFWKDLQWKQV